MFNMTKYFDIIYCATEKRFGDQFCKHSASAYINKDIPAIQRGVCNLSPAALLLFLTHSAAFKPCTHSPCRSLTSQYYCRSGCSPKTKVFFSLRVKAMGCVPNLRPLSEPFVYDSFWNLLGIARTFVTSKNSGGGAWIGGNYWIWILPNGLQ